MKFQRCINKTCCLDKIKFISENTIETASFFYIKIVDNTQRERGAGID
jgi:hypothetical protein